MKLFFTINLFFALTPVYSQVWISSDAKWHYDFENYAFGPSGFYKYSYNQDTVILGKNCQKIVGKSYEFYTYPEVVFVDSSAMMTNYTYTSNDTVYYLNNGEFFVLFDFGASIGDSWIISTTNNGSGFCDDTSRVVVTNTGTVMINSQLLRTITLEPVDSSSYGLTGVFNERFGLMSGSLPWLLFPRYMNYDPNLIIEWNYNSFKCYEDDAFTSYNPSGIDCEYLLTHLDVTEYRQGFFEIYPNPISNTLYLKTQENGTLIFFDLSGKKITSYIVLDNSNIDLTELKSGTYITEFVSVSGIVARELIVKI